MKFFGYCIDDVILCEHCGNRGVDIHHLEPKSRAKSKVNLIDNLMCLCRDCHIRAGSDRAFNEELKLIHRKKLLGVNIDHETERY